MKFKSWTRTQEEHDAKLAYLAEVSAARAAKREAKGTISKSAKIAAKSARRKYESTLVSLRRSSIRTVTSFYSKLSEPKHAQRGCKVFGCTVEVLRTHLEEQFQPGMTWDNYGEWHIDHIKPLASYNLTDREQYYKAGHYTNLQPLWLIDNLRKGPRRPK